jgi:hypothetical protein
MRGLEHSETAEMSRDLNEFLRTQLQMPLDPAAFQDASVEQAEPQEPSSSSSKHQRRISVQAAKRFFEAVLHEGGCDDWRVVIDSGATNPRVESGLRVFFLPDRSFALSEVRRWFVHEIVGHVARAVAGERSLLGLLGLGTRNYLPTKEGFVALLERRMAALHGQTRREDGIWLGTLATGLASGVITPAQTFLSLYTFIESYTLLNYLLQYPHADRQKAHNYAQNYARYLCLRTYRGVPDLEQAGVCYLKDSVYLRGIRMVEQALTEDKTVLDRLAVGRVALEYLPDMQELGIVAPPQSLLKLTSNTEIDTYIQSFESHIEADSDHQAGIKQLREEQSNEASL